VAHASVKTINLVSECSLLHWNKLTFHDEQVSMIIMCSHYVLWFQSIFTGGAECLYLWHWKLQHVSWSVCQVII